MTKQSMDVSVIEHGLTVELVIVRRISTECTNG